jgi:hypothetical protein
MPREDGRYTAGQRHNVDDRQIDLIGPISRHYRRRHLCLLVPEKCIVDSAARYVRYRTYLASATGYLN